MRSTAETNTLVDPLIDKGLTQLSELENKIRNEQQKVADQKTKEDLDKIQGIIQQVESASPEIDLLSYRRLKIIYLFRLAEHLIYLDEDKNLPVQGLTDDAMPEGIAQAFLVFSFYWEKFFNKNSDIYADRMMFFACLYCLPYVYYDKSEKAAVNFHTMIDIVENLFKRINMSYYGALYFCEDVISSIEDCGKMIQCIDRLIGSEVMHVLKGENFKKFAVLPSNDRNFLKLMSIIADFYSITYSQQVALRHLLIKNKNLGYLGKDSEDKQLIRKIERATQDSFDSFSDTVSTFRAKQKFDMAVTEYLNSGAKSQQKIIQYFSAGLSIMLGDRYPKLCYINIKSFADCMQVFAVLSRMTLITHERLATVFLVNDNTTYRIKKSLLLSLCDHLQFFPVVASILVFYLVDFIKLGLVHNNYSNWKAVFFSVHCNLKFLYGFEKIAQELFLKQDSIAGTKTMEEYKRECNAILATLLRFKMSQLFILENCSFERLAGNKVGFNMQFTTTEEREYWHQAFETASTLWEEVQNEQKKNTEMDMNQKIGQNSNNKDWISIGLGLIAEEEKKKLDVASQSKGHSRGQKNKESNKKSKQKGKEKPCSNDRGKVDGDDKNKKKSSSCFFNSAPAKYPAQYSGGLHEKVAHRFPSENPQILSNASVAQVEKTMALFRRREYDQIIDENYSIFSDPKEKGVKRADAAITLLEACRLKVESYLANRSKAIVDVLPILDKAIGVMRGIRVLFSMPNLLSDNQKKSIGYDIATVMAIHAKIENAIEQSYNNCFRLLAKLEQDKVAARDRMGEERWKQGNPARPSEATIKRKKVGEECEVLDAMRVKLRSYRGMLFQHISQPTVDVMAGHYHSFN